MKKLLYILFFIFICSAGFAQTNTKTVDVVSKTGKKLNFQDIKIEGKEAAGSFKTLIIKYKNLSNPSASTTTEGGTSYKCFPDKKSAMSAYLKVKASAADKTTYYVHSATTKKPEIFTFRK